MGIRVLRKAIECAGIFASARTLPEMGEGGGGGGSEVARHFSWS